jgi:two-component sensor histidine kinase
MRIIYDPGDAALSFGIHDLHEPWTLRATMPQVIPARAGVSLVRPRFESMALLAGKVPPKAGDLLGVLLTSTVPIHGRGCQVLRPLWAEEAMHRAYGFVRLVHARNRSGDSTSENFCDEDASARNLAVQFKELAAGREREVLPCSAVLEDVVTSLGALFCCPANIALKTKIDEVSLPSYKRRALVLVAFELVSNALLHAFQGREVGLIEVGLTAHGPKSACLHVADNGNGFTGSLPNLACGVGAGLAGLLEADLSYDRKAGWTIAEIAFPVSGS